VATNVETTLGLEEVSLPPIFDSIGPGEELACLGAGLSERKSSRGVEHEFFQESPRVTSGIIGPKTNRGGKSRKTSDRRARKGSSAKRYRYQYREVTRIVLLTLQIGPCPTDYSAAYAARDHHLSRYTEFNW